MKVVIGFGIIFMIIYLLTKSDTEATSKKYSDTAIFGRHRRDLRITNECATEGKIEEGDNLKSYRVCENQTFVEHTCEKGQFFNSSLEECSPLPGNGEITWFKRGEQCPGDITGLVKHPNKLLHRNYIICLPEMIILAECDVMWYFDDLKKICVEGDDKTITTVLGKNEKIEQILDQEKKLLALLPVVGEKIEKIVERQKQVLSALKDVLNKDASSVTDGSESAMATDEVGSTEVPTSIKTEETFTTIQYDSTIENIEQTSIVGQTDETVNTETTSTEPEGGPPIELTHLWSPLDDMKNIMIKLRPIRIFKINTTPQPILILKKVTIPSLRDIFLIGQTMSSQLLEFDQ